MRLTGGLAALALCIAAQANVARADAPAATGESWAQGRHVLGPVRWRSEVYKVVDGVKLQVEILSPPDAGPKPWPALVAIHGGGHVSGAPRLYTNWLRYFARRGMVVFNVDYRLVTEDRPTSLQEAITDCKSAVRWVRANAERFGIDANRVAVIGDSAGGHLAAAVAILKGLDDPAEDKTVSSVPDLLITGAGSLEITYWWGGYFEKTSGGDRIIEASPEENIAPGDPPAMVWHGTRDTAVNPSCAIGFAQGMAAAGNECALRLMKNVQHAWMLPEFVGENPLSRPRLVAQTLQIIDRYLTDQGYLKGRPTLTDLVPMNGEILREKDRKGLPNNVRKDWKDIGTDQSDGLLQPVVWDVRVYKKVNGAVLRAHVFMPDPVAASAVEGPRPGLVIFHGGEWTSGSPMEFSTHARYLASRGMVVVVPEYRLATRKWERTERLKKHVARVFGEWATRETTVLDSVADAKSAVRWVRANAAQLGVDPKRLAVMGRDAGAQLAACTGVAPGLDDPADDKSISSVPDRMILLEGVLNPAELVADAERIDREIAKRKASSGEAGDKSPSVEELVKQRKSANIRAGVLMDVAQRIEEVSPIGHVKPGAPPTLILHGSADAVVPLSQAEAFAAAMKQAGNPCELLVMEDMPHTWAVPNTIHMFQCYLPSIMGEWLQGVDAWLIDKGYLTGTPPAPLPMMVSQDRSAAENPYPGLNDHIEYVQQR